MSTRIFDDRPCKLGEGPLWHPGRVQLFWFDILGHQLLSRTGDDTQEWDFDEHVSAAGWVDDNTLLLASETGLWRFDIPSGHRTLVAALEADNKVTRSNDGRADPWGGFWIGTMGKNAEPGAGAIYRFYRGELRQLIAPITVSNTICFSPDRRFAYYSDTPTGRVMRQPLEASDGWPDGDAEVFLDLSANCLHPDGAVTDAQGNLWIAQWGASRIAGYAADGRYMHCEAFDAVQTSCPAFGGPDLTTLFCTTAAVGLPAATLTDQPTNGMTFCAPEVAQGHPEYRVEL